MSSIFQPTLPVWGETKCILPQHTRHQYFNPLSPCGERLRIFCRIIYNYNFNPLSPCGERQYSIMQDENVGYFNPLSPCGERPHEDLDGGSLHLISTHSPRVGRDIKCKILHLHLSISTHSPRVGRDGAIGPFAPWEVISTHSPRVGRDSELRQNQNLLEISTHSPRVGRDIRRGGKVRPRKRNGLGGYRPLETNYMGWNFNEGIKKLWCRLPHVWAKTGLGG